MDRSPVPLYHRLYRALADRIANGAYLPGSQLPGERTLMEEFRVGRQTVLAAMQRLTAAGLIERFAGRGTFVVETRVQPSRWTFDSLEDLIEAGQAGHYAIVGADMVPAENEPRLRATFGLARDEMLFYVRALRSSDEGPYAYSRIYLPRPIGERLPRALLPTKPLLLLLEVYAGVTIVEARQLTSAVPADHEEAAVLEVAEGAPLLAMRRRFFDEDGRAVVHALVTARPDRYEQIVHFRRRDATARSGRPARRSAQRNTPAPQHNGRRSAS